MIDSTQPPISAVHAVSDGLPREVGYTLRTHHLARAQLECGMSVRVAVMPEQQMFESDRYLSNGMGVSTIDGVDYHRFAPKGRFRRTLARTARFMHRKKIRGAWSLQRWVTTSVSSPWERLLDAMATGASLPVLHAHTPWTCAQDALTISRRRGLPFVYEIRGFWEQSAESTGRTQVNGSTLDEWRARDIEMARQADAVITLGSEMRKELESRGIPAARIRIVGNGVDTRQLRPAPGKDQELVREYDLAGAFVAGYVTNVRRLEGLDVLLDAVRLLREKGIPAVAMIVGDGPDLARLKEIARATQNERGVRFVGKVPHAAVSRFYTLFDAFVVPRSDLPVCRTVTPLKPLEAMACGIPVVASRLPALEELVVHEKRGLCFRADDSADLADSLERLRDDARLQQRLRDGARQWVVDERDWRALAGVTAEVYRQVLAVQYA